MLTENVTQQMPSICDQSPVWFQDLGTSQIHSATNRALWSCVYIRLAKTITEQQK